MLSDEIIMDYSEKFLKREAQLVVAGVFSRGKCPKIVKEFRIITRL